MIERRYTVPDAAEILGLKPRAVWYLIEQGLLDTVRDKYVNRRLVMESALADYQRRSVAPVIELDERRAS
jgi:Helix-turn-helix domain